MHCELWLGSLMCYESTYSVLCSRQVVLDALLLSSVLDVFEQSNVA